MFEVLGSGGSVGDGVVFGVGRMVCLGFLVFFVLIVGVFCCGLGFSMVVGLLLKVIFFFKDIVLLVMVFFFLVIVLLVKIVLYLIFLYLLLLGL